MNKSRDPNRTGSIIDLYNKIPDYSEVQHLGNSEFINKVEKLKEEFRQIRASLYEDSDVECIAESTSKVLNISNTEDLYNKNQDTRAIKFSKSAPDKVNNWSRNYETRENYSLSIRGCELHRNPYNSGAIEYSRPSYTYRPIEYSKSSSSLLPTQQGNDYQYADDKSYSLAQDGIENGDSDASTPESTFSRWSSNPEVYSNRRKEYIPPANVEKRLSIRKSQTKIDQIPAGNESPPPFRAHPIPSHVYEPLLDKIMLKNQKRSQKVREESKQKLMAQVKPFSFTKPSGNSHGLGRSTASGHETLNNRKSTKPRKSVNTAASIKTNNNKFSSTQSMFRANPAPPRNKALMAAMRLREQQEYRELKRRLRSEALMKIASLPPAMAARDKNTRSNDSRLEAILNAFEDSAKPKKSKNKKVQLASDDDQDSTATDEDRMSENSYASNKAGADTSSSKHSKTKKMHFQSYDSILKHRPADAVFESTSNDNHASRLRVQAAKKKEEARIHREEEELLKIVKCERKQQKLRDSHLHVWRQACSYSAAQDIAMRRQLRFAAAILERECFRKDMSTMLCRVRSAPLLLEGVRERRFEPCKKHKQELLQLSDRSSKFNTPRLGIGREKYYSRINWTSHGDVAGERYGVEKSETVALAEGSLTNSDNESVKNIQLDTTSGDEDSEKEESEIDKKPNVDETLSQKVEEKHDELNNVDHERVDSEEKESEDESEAVAEVVGEIEVLDNIGQNDAEDDQAEKDFEVDVDQVFSQPVNLSVVPENDIFDYDYDD